MGCIRESMGLGKIIDASPIFFQERQSRFVEELFDETHRQETYNPNELLAIIKQVNSVDVSNLSETVQNKFQTLCGRVHTLSVNHRVDEIYEEATALSSGEYNSSKELTYRIQTLKEMLTDVWSNNSLSQENSNFIQVASKKLSVLSAQPSFSKKDDMVHCFQINFIENEEMLPESEVIGSVVTSEWEDAELSIEILQVAQLLHQGHPEGIIKFRQLPQNVQKELGPADHSAEYIREMVTMGMQMGRKDGYSPSQKEVELMFSEAPPVG